MAQDDLLELPNIVKERLISYKSLWKLFISIHYAVGILGLCASIIASSIQEPWNRGFALGAAICFGVISFIKPERQYFKYVRAWRTIDNGAIRYSLRLESKKSLMQKLDHAESILYEFEEKQIESGKDEG
jgi:hypothetical protein